MSIGGYGQSTLAAVLNGSGEVSGGQRGGNHKVLGVCVDEFPVCVRNHLYVYMHMYMHMHMHMYVCVNLKKKIIKC